MKKKKQYLKPTIRVIGVKLGSGLADPILVHEITDEQGSDSTNSDLESNHPATP